MCHVDVQVRCHDNMPRDRDAGPQPRWMHSRLLDCCLDGASGADGQTEEACGDWRTVQLEAAVSSHGFCAEGTATGCVPSGAGLAGGMEPLLPHCPSQRCLPEDGP